MHRKENHRDRPELNDTGCIRLIEAIVRRAAEDYLRARQRLPGRKAAARVRETTAFFRSDYFRRLTGVQGDILLRKIREEAKRK